MRKESIIKLLVSVVIIGGALGYLIYNAMSSSWAYDISVEDFLGNSDVQSYVARVGGVVEKGSIKRDVETMQINFRLTGKDIAMPVYYSGIIPENFDEEREVLVEGRLEGDGVFKADRIITKCESKYKAKLKE